MTIEAKKYLTVQFHLENTSPEEKLDNFVNTHPSKRNYHSKISTRVDDIEKAQCILENFANSNQYEFEYYGSKHEFHIRIPGNYLIQQSIQERETGLEKNSSNKTIKSNELSLLNFLGDVIYTMPANSSNYHGEEITGFSSSIKGFIRTTVEKRNYLYNKLPINKSTFENLKSQVQQKSIYNENLNSKCIGLITPQSKTNYSSNSETIEELSFEQTADKQTIETIAPSIRTINYTGISMLSALKSAIADSVNNPDVLVLQNGNSKFDYTETEKIELNHQLRIAAMKGISIVSPFKLEHDNNFLLGSTDNILNSLPYSLKCFIGNFTNDSNELIPITYKGNLYACPMPQLNPILWAIRIAYLSNKLGYRLGYFQNFIENRVCLARIRNIIFSIKDQLAISYNNILSKSETLLIKDLITCFECKGEQNNG